MAANVRQHYVPAGYLAAFAANPQAGRKARLHVFDGERAFVAPVEDLCVEKDFYTSVDRQLESDIHGDPDSDLPALVRKLQGPHHKSDLRMAFVQAALLYTRGYAFRNESATSRLEASEHAGAVFVCSHILGLRGAANEKAETLLPKVGNVIGQEWGFAAMTPSRECTDPTFLTSDCPVMVVGVAAAPTPNLLVWPLTPTCLFVAVRKSDLTIKPGGYTDPDAAWVNGTLGTTSHRFLFSRDPYPAHQLDIIKKIFKKRPVDGIGNAFHNDHISVNTPKTRTIPLSFLKQARAPIVK